MLRLYFFVILNTLMLVTNAIHFKFYCMCYLCLRMSYCKESVVSDVTHTADELPTIVAKLQTTGLWSPSNTLYPFSHVLRLRVLQVTDSIYRMPWCSRKVLFLVKLNNRPTLSKRNHNAIMLGDNSKHSYLCLLQYESV